MGIFDWFNRKRKTPAAGEPGEGVNPPAPHAREQRKGGAAKTKIPDAAPLRPSKQPRSSTVESLSQRGPESSLPVRPLSARPRSESSGKLAETASKISAPAPPLSPNQASPAERALGQLGEKSIRARAAAVAALDAGESIWFGQISSRSASPQVAEALGILGYPSAVNQLRDWACTSDDARLAMATAVALGRLLDPSVSESLRTKLAGLVATRRRQKSDLGSFWTEAIAYDFAKTLGVLGDVAALPVIIEMLRCHDTAFGPEALSEFAHDCVEPLILLLDDESVNHQRILLDFLGGIGDVRMVEPLIRQLGSSHDYMAESAIKGLGKVGGPRALEALVEVLQNRPANQRSLAALALTKLHEPQATEVVRESLRSSDAETRRAAAIALASVKDLLALEPLKEMLNGSESDRPILQALARLGQPESLDALIAIFNASTSEDERTAIAQILGEIGDRRSVQALYKAMTDGEDNVQLAIATALGNLGERRALAVLSAVVWAEGSEYKVGQAVEALGKIGDPSAIEPLVFRLRGSLLPIRRAIWTALERIGVPAIDGLLMRLQDPRPAVRAVVSEALGQMGDHRARNPLDIAARDSISFVQTKALEAIRNLERRLQSEGSISTSGAENDKSPLPRKTASSESSLLSVEPMRPAPVVGDQRSYICDICAANMVKTSGYAYTTKQVVTSVRYWRWYFEHGRESNTDRDGDGVGLSVSMLAGTGTPWIVCEDCVQYIDADHKIAKANAAAGEAPSGCGPVDPQIACIPAGYGWSLAYDEWPTSIQIGKNPVIRDMTAGSRCDFCRRILYGDEKFGLLTADTYKKLLDEGAWFVRQPRPSRQVHGADCWIGCNTCLKRAGAL